MSAREAAAAVIGAYQRLVSPWPPGPGRRALAGQSEAGPPRRLAGVTPPLYNAAVSREGGKLEEFTLKYGGEKPMIVIGELGPSGLVMAPSGNNSAQVGPMDLPA